MFDDNPYDSIVSAASGPKPDVGAAYNDIIERHATANGIDSNLVRAVMGQESSGNRVAVSPKGARGLMQLMPATAKRFGVTNPNDPEQNIAGGTKYLKFLSDRYSGDIDKTLAAYNAGEGSVDKYGGIPPFKETQNYVPSVKARYAKLSGQSRTQKSPSNPYDSIVSAATAPDTQTPAIKAAEADVANKRQAQTNIAAQVQAATPNPYDSIVAAAIPQATGRGAGTARAGQVAVTRGAKAAPLGWEGGGTIGQGITTPIPTTAAHTIMNRPAVRASSAGRGAFALTPEEQMRVTPPGTITPTTNHLVANVINQKDQADTASKGLSNIAAMGGVPTSLLPKDAEDWINSAVAQGGAGLMNTAAGLVRHGIPALEVAKMFGAPDILQKPVADKLQSVSNEMSSASQAVDRNADRGVVSQTVKDVVGGGIATTPAMILVSMGVPPPVAFGMQSSAEAQGRDADLADTIKDTTKGAAIGALFELPLPTRIAMANQLGQRLAKAGIVGVGTKAVDLASGANPNDLSSPIVNALFAASGAPKSEVVVPETAPREASIAPVIADARAERIQANLQGLKALPQPDNAIVPSTAPAEPLRVERSDAEGVKLNRWQHRDFGAVTESVNQSGVGKGRVRVLAEDGTEHVIQRPNMRGEGNNIAVPVRPKPIDNQTADAQAEAERTAPFRVIDKRGQAETPAQAEARREQVASSVTPQPDLSTQAQPAILDTANVTPQGAAGVASMPEGKPVYKIRPAETLVTGNEVSIIDPDGRNLGWIESPEEAQRYIEKLGGKLTPLEQKSRAASEAAPIPEKQSAESTPQVKERAFPKTLAATGRASGTDLTYEVVGDKDAVDKASARITADPEAARQFALSGNGNNTTPQGKERIATGLKLADQLASQAENSKDPVDAATKHAQAVELYTKTATDLTEAGQTVQAASLAQKYSLTGAPLEVVRIAKRNGNIPKASDISDVRDMAKRRDDLESRLADVQKQIETMQANGKKTTATPRAKVETLTDRLAKIESDARARLDARAKLAQSQTVGPKDQRGSGINPIDVAASIADWTTIGAAKIARGGLNFAAWSKEMVGEFGEAIKPHLNKIFLAAHKLASEQRTALKEESTQRSATKSGMSLDDFKQQRYELQTQKRQARLDMDRKFNELDRRAQRGPLKKTADVVGSVLTNSLLSYHGLLNILSTMTAKEGINAALRVPEAGLDLVERGIARTFGKQIPRASAGPSPRQLGRAVKTTVTEGPGNIAKAFMGKPSEVMPNVHKGPLDSPKLNLVLDFMSRHYAAKEALIRTPTYNLERSNQASIMAHNDITDGVIKRSQLNDRIDGYLNGRASLDGPLNKKYAASLADQAADYEIKSRNPTTNGIVTPSAKAARVKEMMTNPTQLIDSQALQYADKESYANPLGPRMQKIQDALNAGGPIPKALIQPFFKRPVNAFNDLLYSYTGAKAVKEGGQAAINALRGQEWTPAERQSFNRAVARGGTVYGLAALGYALAGRGLLTSGNDKDHPGSLKVGNSYYAIGNKPVIGWAIVAGATARIDGVSAVPGAVGRMVLDHPLLKGLKNVTDAAEEGYQATQGKTAKLGKAATGFAGKTLGRAIPTPIAATAETMDTQNRDTKGLTGPLKARIPFVRQQLPPTGPKERGSAFDPFLAQPIKLKPRGKALRF